VAGALPATDQKGWLLAEASLFYFPRYLLVAPGKEHKSSGHKKTGPKAGFF